MGLFTKVFKRDDSDLDEKIQLERARLAAQQQKQKELNTISAKRQELKNLREQRRAGTPTGKLISSFKKGVSDIGKSMQGTQSRTHFMGAEQGRFSPGNSFGSGLAIDSPNGQGSSRGFMIDAPMQPLPRKKQDNRPRSPWGL